MNHTTQPSYKGVLSAPWSWTGGTSSGSGWLAVRLVLTFKNLEIVFFFFYILFDIIQTNIPPHLRKDLQIIKLCMFQFLDIQTVSSSVYTFLGGVFPKQMVSKNPGKIDTWTSSSIAALKAWNKVN